MLPRFPLRPSARLSGALVVGLLVAAVGPTVEAEKPPMQNVHRPDADCARCHTADRPTLEGDPHHASGLLAPDLEERCILCHSSEGPSHHTGMRPVKPVPDTLPLSAEGLITCATCHFMHGEQNAFGSYVRIDNRHGGLCLTCHTLSELE